MRIFCFTLEFFEGGERNKLVVIHKRMNADQVSVESFNIVQDSYVGE